MIPPSSRSRCGAVLILVVGMIAILATIATAFLARSRGTAAVGEDAIRLAQTRIMLNAGISFIREASRLGYAEIDGSLMVTDVREGWGWIDTRVVVPGTGTRIGPNAADGTPLWTAGTWPAPGSVIRAPMYRMVRPPFAISQDYVRNPIPTDIGLPTFGLPFLANVDPLPLLPDGSYFDIDRPILGGSSMVPAGFGSTDPRRVWAEGDRTPIPGTADLAWFRVYREQISVAASGEPVSSEPASQNIPASAGICTFIITVGAGGTRGYQDWAEVTAADKLSFGGSRELFEELLRSEQRQWFRVGWSAAVGGGEDLIVHPAIEGGGREGPALSQYEMVALNVSRYNADDFVAPSHPRNYGGTIT